MKPFGKFKNQKKYFDDDIPEQDQNIEGYAPLDQENMKTSQDDFVAGMEDPDKSKGDVQGVSTQKKALILILGILAIIIIIAGVVIMGIREFMPSGDNAAQKEQAKIEKTLMTNDDEKMALIEEKKRLESLIQTQKQEMGNMQDEINSTIDKKFTQYFESFKTNGENLPGSNKEVQELKKQQADLISTIQGLQSTIQEMKVEKEAAELVPEQGDTNQSTLYDGIGQYKQKKEAYEKAVAKRASQKPDYIKGDGIQTGTLLSAKLITRIESCEGMDSFLAVAETTDPYEIVPGGYLPRGVRFVGKAVADHAGRRIYIPISKMQYGNVEMPVEGMILDGNGNPGLVSEYRDPTQQAAWRALPLNILAAAAGAKIETEKYMDNDGYERTTISETAENEMYESAQDALNTQADYVRETVTSKQPSIIVKQGIDAKIQISEKIPFDILLESGIISQGGR